MAKRKAKKFTNLQVKSFRDPGMYADGQGLYLRVSWSKNRTKSWILRIMKDGKRQDIGLGGYPTVSLSDARNEAARLRAEIKQGNTPTTARNRRKAVAPSVPTFEMEARRFHAENETIRWTNLKNRKIWLQRAETYLFPAIGSMPITDVTPLDLLKVIEPLWGTKRETAYRLKLIAKQTFMRSLTIGLIQSDPSQYLEGGLPYGRQIREHFKALHYSQVSEALAQVEQSSSAWPTKLCVRFTTLTATRSRESRGATWDEINWSEKLWTIPAERMKMNKPHIVPLSNQAMDILRQARLLADTEFDHIFHQTNPRIIDKPISENAMNLLFRKLGINGTPHGMRSAFKDWSEEQTSADWAAIEISLSHTVGSNVERAYFRSNMLLQRRELMQDWADYIMPT